MNHCRRLHLLTRIDMPISHFHRAALKAACCSTTLVSFNSVANAAGKESTDNDLQTLPDFKIETVMQADGKVNGTWISLGKDSEGRLLLGGCKRGQPATRLTLDDQGHITKTEVLKLPVSEIMGQFFVGDALYVDAAGIGAVSGCVRLRAFPACAIQRAMARSTAWRCFVNGKTARANMARMASFSPPTSSTSSPSAATSPRYRMTWPRPAHIGIIRMMCPFREQRMETGSSQAKNSRAGSSPAWTSMERIPSFTPPASAIRMTSP